MKKDIKILDDAIEKINGGKQTFMHPTQLVANFTNMKNIAETVLRQIGSSNVVLSELDDIKFELDDSKMYYKECTGAKGLILEYNKSHNQKLKDIINILQQEREKIQQKIKDKIYNMIQVAVLICSAIAACFAVATYFK